MKHQTYYPTSAAQQIIWLENFRNKLSAHAPTLGLPTPQCAAIIADARWLIYILGSWLPAVREWGKSCTSASLEAQNGDGTTLMDLPIFNPPALPAAVGGNPAVVPVTTAALQRIFALIQNFRELTACTDTVANDLGILGTAQNAPDYDTLQPVITAKVITDLVNIGWGWGGNGDFIDQCEIQVDRGQGWAFPYDSTPNYTDATPHPATTTKWKNRAIYRLSDARVGLWSNEGSVAVGG